MTAGSTNGSSTNVVLFERPDIHAFWTAYDPLDMAGESIDPLGFMAGYISLADRILPGFTLRACLGTLLRVGGGWNRNWQSCH